MDRSEGPADGPEENEKKVGTASGRNFFILEFSTKSDFEKCSEHKTSF